MGKWIRIAVWYGFFIYGAVTGRWGIMAVSLLFAAVPTWRICAGKWRDRRIQTMWDRFTAGSPEAADAALQIWTLPAGGKDLAERVRRGEISGESFSVDYFTRHDRPLPQPGAFYVLCGRDRSPICVVQTVSVERCRFAEVTDRLAAIEGYASPRSTNKILLLKAYCRLQMLQTRSRLKVAKIGTGRDEQAFHKPWFAEMKDGMYWM